MSILISLFDRIKETKTVKSIPLEIFLEKIQGGFWQDTILPIRAQKDKPTRQELKKLIPAVTISGIFPERKDNECKLHSGFIAVDLDDITDIQQVKAVLSHDPYVYAIFVSVSGYGLCALFKIEPEKHREAFAAISDYLLKKYQLVTDPTGVNPSRARYVSYDPHLIHNQGAELFKKYLPKEKKKKSIPTVFVRNEFEDIVRQMVERNVSCVEDYRDWLKVSFGLADQFGEAGRNYFHSLSSCSNKYDPAICDKQYNHALKRDIKTGIKVTISTIYYYAKQAGISIQSEATKRITSATSSLKKSGLDKSSIIETLEKFEGITAEQSKAIVNEAFDSGVDYTDKENIIDNVLLFIKNDMSLKRNLITRKLENSGSAMEDIDLNSAFLRAKRVFNTLTFDLFVRCLLSNNTVSYNPFIEWWNSNKNVPYNNEINRMWDCFDTDDMDKLKDFGTRWLVSIVSSVYGIQSPLVLVLAGEGGKGKTEFFRRLLPPGLLDPVSYYAESRLDKGTDDHILMCQKLIIMDDEFGGQSKTEERRFKALSDAKVFSLREPYGRSNVDLKRLAVLCGTSNEFNLLGDSTTMNRRILPMAVNSVDYMTYNSIDKTALFAELFRMYHAGFKWTVTGEDIERLNYKTERFINFSLEYELINEYFSIPPEGDRGNVVELSTGEIKTRIDQRSGQRTILNKVGQELKRLGFAQQIKKINRKPSRVWQVVERAVTGFGAMPSNRFDAAEPTPDIQIECPF